MVFIRKLLKYIQLFMLLFTLLHCFHSHDAVNNKREITVKQGERFSDFCRRLENENLTDCMSFEAVSRKYDFKEFPFVPPGENTVKFEGLFRPGKYFFNAEDIACIENEMNNTSDASCNDAKLKNAEKIVLLLLEKSSDRHSGESQKEFLNAITLASIIEKEAASNKDYEFIASVFHNRLKKNMPLGSCPTVEYVLGYHRPFLLNKDLEVNSPYNVYRRKGLPPSPIAFFSDKALNAARNPPDSGYLFFVFDWTTGDLSFSENFEKHKEYAAKARKNYIEKFGEDSIHKVYYDKFYEL